MPIFTLKVFKAPAKNNMCCFATTYRFFEENLLAIPITTIFS